MISDSLKTVSAAKRNRRVRRSYPDPFVQLILLLCHECGIRETVSAFGLRTSTTYRWIEKAPSARHNGRLEAVLQDIRTLVAQCESLGFGVRSLVYGLHPLSHRLPGNSSTTPSADKISGLSLVTTVDVDLASRSGPLEAGAKVLGSRRTGETEAMKRVKKAIDDRYAQRWTTARLSGLIGYSKFDFIRSFTAMFQISPHQYLISVRVKHAETMLKNSSLSLPVVARAVGFGSASAMQRAFIAISGASPGTLVNNIAAPAGAANPGVRVSSI